MTPWLPLLPLVTAAAYVAALRLDTLWQHHTGEPPARIVTLALAAAVHAAWLLPASRRAAPALVTIAWLVSVRLVVAGLTAVGFTTGALTCTLILEGIALALALSMTEAASWPDRLARWRRARQRIYVELEMAEGLVPWATGSIKRLIGGRAVRPAALVGFDRMAAEIADASERFGQRMGGLALPEAVRQTLLASAQNIASHAETVAAQAAVAIERQALVEAAACRDALEHLPDATPHDRAQLARECEALVLDLARDVWAPGRRATDVSSAMH